MARIVFHKRIILRYAVGIPAVFAFILCLTWIVLSFFSIRTIEIAGDRIALDIDQRVLKTNLLFFPADRLRRQILKEYVQLSDITIEKRLPHTLRITAKIRTPFVILKSQGRSVLLDESGMVLGDDAGSLRLPVLAFDKGSVIPGTMLSYPEIRTSLILLHHVDASFPILSVTSFDGTSLFATMDKTDIYFPQSDEAGMKASTLQTLLSGFRIKGYLPAKIDLRFDKPVIVF